MWGVSLRIWNDSSACIILDQVLYLSRFRICVSVNCIFELAFVHIFCTESVSCIFCTLFVQIKIVNSALGIVYFKDQFQVGEGLVDSLLHILEIEDTISKKLIKVIIAIIIIIITIIITIIIIGESTHFHRKQDLEYIDLKNCHLIMRDDIDLISVMILDGGGGGA